MEDARGDDVLDALSDVVEVLEGAPNHLAVVNRRAQHLRRGRAQGASYAELIIRAEGPLVIEVVTDLLDGLLDAGSRLRRAEARALYAEGLSMDKISRLLRVSRQRVSTLIRGPVGESALRARRDLRRSIGLALTDPEVRMIADAIPQIVWISGADGSAEYFNREGREYTGVPAERTYGSRWVELVHPDDQVRALAAWKEAVDAETPFALDYRMRRFDGEFRWHRFRANPVRGLDGRVARWIGTATDVDYEKQLEGDRHK